MATRRRGSRVEESPWVAEVEAAVVDGGASEEESARWRRHCIYHVPACIKDLNPKAYRPQVVSLGPYHHGEPQLRPLDAHKRRALVHFLRRARRPLAEFAAAVAGGAEEYERLEGAYEGLGGEWRGAAGEERFVELMVTDGCFLLEVMRAASGWEVNDYAAEDPVFSPHGLLYTVPYIRRDMIMIENQLPLLVLDRLLAVETGKNGNEELINRMVLLFLSPTAWPLTTGVGLALHPLDVLRRSLLYGPSPAPRAPPPRDSSPAPPDDIIRSAEELYEAGVRFKRSATGSLLDIRFHRGTLYLPPIAVDDTTEYMLLNLVAFERLHAGAGNDVTAYVFFMDNMVDTARDVALLTARRVVHNAVGSDKAVARLLNGLSRDVVLEPQSALDGVHREVNAYCRKPWNRWRSNLVRTYFRSPWSFLSLAAAVFLLVMTVLQTVYTVVPYYNDNS
ncbi:hypothetical protein GQ55_3G406500 [Panicum hallii var. hallii]|uniref:Uncharacterized protein n=1 Tax=Panicum hallii var. hallii TaxID=1504633 RepID=A0A2T7EH05_9POAL|nr:hypothetical protein GQ55_3G406500 [Panicum hallii var. hallii]